MGYNKRKQDKPNDGAAVANTSGLMFAQSTKCLAYHPTNAQPQTPEQGGKWSALANYALQDTTPAAIEFNYMPIFGSNIYASKNSTLNFTCFNIWNSLRNFCTTAVNYQPGDVLNTIIQLGQVPILLAKVRRKMKSVRMGSDGYNYYVRDLYKMLNVPNSEADRSADISNMNSYVQLYNSIVQDYNKVALPDFFPIFHRWAYMEEEIFTDVDPAKFPNKHTVQWYFFNNSWYYETKLADPSIPGSQMDPKVAPQNIQGLLTMLRTLVTDLYQDSTVREIYGDMRQTYGTDNLWKLETITIEDIEKGIEPKFDPDLNWLLYNATVFPVQAPTLNIDAATGELQGTYFLDNTGMGTQLEAEMKAYINHPKLYNAQKWDTTTEEFAKYTQWTLHGYDSVVGVRSPGTEIITRMSIWGYDFRVNGQPSLNSVLIPYGNMLCEVENTSCTEEDALKWICYSHALSAFPYAPMMYNFLYTAQNEMQLASIQAELELPVFLDQENLFAWHNAVREALWGLPIDITYKTRKS